MLHAFRPETHSLHNDQETHSNLHHEDALY